MRDLHRIGRQAEDSYLAQRAAANDWTERQVAVRDFRAACARILSMRQNLRTPFPREMGVHPHQLLANVIAARRQFRALVEYIATHPEDWDRRRDFVFHRLHRKLFGESISSWARRLERKEMRA